MGSYILQLAREEPVTLSPAIADRLISGGNGDAALLYLCLARHGEAGEPEQLCAILRWNRERFTQAESALRSLQLIRTPEQAAAVQPAKPVTPAPASGPAPPPPPETAIPEYSREDVMNKLEQDDTFSTLLREVERKLGRLSDPSVRKLLGLYDYLGLPADVIYLLVNYCAEKKTDRFGNTRPPTMREIEKEGYAWARRELFSAAAADEWIKTERGRRSRFSEYMEVLQLGRRAPSPGEEKYLTRWFDMRFPPASVAIAYDKTMLKCHELKWPYLNGILQSWHEKGLHTPQEVSGEKTPGSGGTGGKAADPNAWMDEYIK